MVPTDSVAAQQGAPLSAIAPRHHSRKRISTTVIMLNSQDVVSSLWARAQQSPWLAAMLILTFVVFLRVLVIVTYRLTLSPLAKFPGSKLAAATGLYETYFNLVKNGQYVFKIERLHDIYGAYAVC
jgi:hypothetical protein